MRKRDVKIKWIKPAKKKKKLQSSVSPGLCGGQERLWLNPRTLDTNSLRHCPLAGGCGPSGPKPHSTERVSFLSATGLINKGTGLPLAQLLPSTHPDLRYINVGYTDSVSYIKGPPYIQTSTLYIAHFKYSAYLWTSGEYFVYSCTALFILKQYNLFMLFIFLGLHFLAF